MTSIHYFAKLEQKLGHSRNDDVTTLSDHELVELGKAVAAEYRLIDSGGPNSALAVTRAMQDIEKAMSDDPDKDVETATEYALNIRNIGYNLAHVGVAKPEDRRSLREECWHFWRRILVIEEKYEGELGDLWHTYADMVHREIHYWSGHFDRLNIWLHSLQNEFKKRQPGYEEPKVEQMSDEDFAALSEAFFDDDYEYDEKDAYIDNMEDAFREQQQSRFLLEKLKGRAERLLVEQHEETESLREDLKKSQSLTVLEYEDQLNGLVREVNDKFARNLRLLDEQEPLEGKTIEMYFNGPHPRVGLALRYGEDLRKAAKWSLKILKRINGNKFLVEQTSPPHQKYEVGLGFDDKDNHFFCFTFFNRRWGRKWMEAEQRIGPRKADQNGLPTYKLIQYHNTINKHFEEDSNWADQRKKRAGS